MEGSREMDAFFLPFPFGIFGLNSWLRALGGVGIAKYRVGLSTCTICVAARARELPPTSETVMLSYGIALSEIGL